MMKKLLTKTLLVAATLLLGGGANFVWGDTTIGATGSNWQTDGSYTDAAILSEGKCRTFTFTVDELGTNGYDSYCLNVTNTGSPQVFNANTYLFIRSSDRWYTYDAPGNYTIYNANTYGATSVNSVITGATVVMSVRRLNKELIVSEEITTTSSDKYYCYYVQDLGTTEDLYAFLAADFAKLTISSDVTTDIDLSDKVEIPIGDGTNFLTSYVKTLEPNGVVNLQFVNTDVASQSQDYKTWGVELIFNDGENHYFDINSGDLNPWGDLLKSGTPEAVDAKIHTLSKSSNWPASGIRSKLEGATITLTVARNGRVVTMTAVNTPTSGDPFSFTYTLEPKDAYTDFGTGNIEVRLIARNCRINNYYPISKVNAEVTKYGWATFSSPYKLDFSGVENLEAYAVTDHVGSVVTKSDALGVVAANKGVLLKGVEGSNSTYYNIPVSTGEAYDGTNLMVAGTGASVSAEEGKTKYVLGVSGSDKAEFQKIVSTSATVATGKAYLQFNEVISARAMSFEGDDVTGVENIEAPAEATLKEGKFIENGKLVIVKNGMKFNAAGQQMK